MPQSNVTTYTDINLNGGHDEAGLTFTEKTVDLHVDNVPWVQTPLSLSPNSTNEAQKFSDTTQTFSVQLPTTQDVEKHMDEISDKSVFFSIKTDHKIDMQDQYEVAMSETNFENKQFESKTDLKINEGDVVNVTDKGPSVSLSQKEFSKVEVNAMHCVSNLNDIDSSDFGQNILVTHQTIFSQSSEPNEIETESWGKYFLCQGRGLVKFCIFEKDF